MTRFRLLSRTRQVTEYSCGACALQAVLSYWGKDVEEEELMRLMQTTSEEGTYPENMVRGARALGFEAEAKENLTLDDVATYTASGDPMIALAQVWRSESSSPGNPENDWDNGHYIVVLGVDDEYVYFQDPYARMCKVFVPRKTFEQHWHQVMGGDLKRNPKLMRVGILVRGRERRERDTSELPSLSDINFERFGSLNVIVTVFPRFVLPYDFLTELKGIWADGHIRPSAFIFLRKDADGNVSGMEGGRLQDEDDVAATNAILAAIANRSIGEPEQTRSKVEAAISAAAAGDFGLSAGDLRRIAGKLAANQSAIIILFENAWERTFREVAGNYGGTVVNQRLITPSALAKAARDIAGSAG